MEFLTEVLLPIIIVLNLTYLYFWVVLLFARANNHIDRSKVSSTEIKRFIRSARRNGQPSNFTILITTKGGSIGVVDRGIRYALAAVRKYRILKVILVIEVVTEEPSEAAILAERYRDAIVPVNVFVMPSDYETPLGTKFKARALHYMVEQHRANPRDAYIVHYDEESVFTADNLARLVRNLLRKPVGISEGSISYPLEWMESNAICRTMESNRPFGCHECYLVMTNPAPLHLHGSNLVVQERIENEVGWDIGLFDGNPLIAEDLVFGLMAYVKYGKDVFGWHGAEMLEQPPFTLKAAYKQRERWVMGALQGVSHVTSMDGWRSVSLAERFKIQLIIRLRILTYALGLPVSILSLLAGVSLFLIQIMHYIVFGHVHFDFSALAIPGLLMWLGGVQIGLRQNLRYTKLTGFERLREHLTVLFITPISGLFDTLGPVVAVAKWGVGIRGIKWIPTPKNVGQEFGESAPISSKVLVETA